MIGRETIAGSQKQVGFVALLLAGVSLGACQASPPPISQAAPVAADRLASEFATPPDTARPRVWWHWMNGNVTKEGIRKDLEWLDSVGIGGVQNFDAALSTPQIVDERLVYMTDPWKDAFRYAVELAEEKGLEFAIAASPGWSETGGPWVPPQDGMKKLVWSETVVAGGKPLTAPLPMPPRATGTFLDQVRGSSFPGAEGHAETDSFYGDAAVLAFPANAAPAAALSYRLSVAGEGIRDPQLASDGLIATSAIIPLPADGSKTHLYVDFPEARDIRAMNLAFGPGGGMFGGGIPTVMLQLEGPGGSWIDVAEIPNQGPQATLAFEPFRARRLRLELTPVPVRSLAFLGSVEGAVTDIFPTTVIDSTRIAELGFTEGIRVDRFESKAGFSIAESYHDLPERAASADMGVRPAQIIDLTDRMSADGTLDWTPPPGEWRILRLGYSLTGTTNHPATAEATGLEVDKFDRAAVARYLDHYIGMMEDAVGRDMVGERGIRAILTDSTEIGPSNWTPDMIARFRELRGYDPTPWLPALTGTVVRTRADSDKFLYDFRRTLGDLMASEHYFEVARVAHEHGLTVYGEALEAGRPVLGNELSMRAKTDIPMAALWTYDPVQGPRSGLLGDMKGAASVAHVEGQNLVAAESLTAAFSPWAFAPVDLKPVIDLEFAYGINRPVIHTSVHQPSDDHRPGLSLGPFGQYFNRHETWAGMAKPWVDYIARSSHMLQQGRYFADVAYFYGEDTPLTVLYDDGPPADAPREYAFDFVSADMLTDTLQAVDGELVAPSGARFKALYLGGTSARMTLPVLRRIAQFADAGVTIVGDPPVSSPSLADDEDEFRALVSRLWGESGKAIPGTDVEAALLSKGIEPDFVAGEDTDVLFLHRRLEDGDAYFLTNRQDRAVQTEGRFRVTGKSPELWNAQTGQRTPLSFRTDGEQTVVPLHLAAQDAVFVVFRQDSSAASRDVPLPTWRNLGTIDGAWTARFEEGRGAPPAIELPELASLSDSSDPGIRYFSGTTSYARSFTLPAGVAPGDEVMLDLGQVGDVAEIFVNGSSAGIVWNPPYRVDIGKLVNPGENRLEIRVANLWVNRLIGDVQPGGEKIAYTALPTYKPDAPLRPAGLIGPVTLLSREER